MKTIAFLFFGLLLPSFYVSLTTWYSTEDNNIDGFSYSYTPQSTSSGSPSFVRLYGGDLEDSGFKLKPINGDFFLLSSEVDNTTSSNRGIFSKINSSGSIVWQAQFSPGYRMVDFIEHNGDFLLVGYTVPYNFSSNSIICKVSSTGAKLWAMEYSFSSRERLSKIALAPSNDPNIQEFYLYGRANVPGSFSEEDQLLVKIDENGNEIFKKILDYNNGDDQADVDFFRLSNGKYISVGYRTFNAQIGVIDETGTNAFFASEGNTNYQLIDGVEANEKVYLVGRNNLDQGFILVLDKEANKRVARYTLPDIGRINKITANTDGDLYLGAQADLGDGISTRYLIYKLSEAEQIGDNTNLSIEWVKTIDQGETEYSSLDISTDDDQFIYMDSRVGNPNNIGGRDIFIGFFNLDMGGGCVSEILNHSISGPQIIDDEITASYTITDQTFPIVTNFSIEQYTNYSQAEPDCPIVESDPYGEFCGQAAVTCLPGILSNGLISNDPVLGIVDVRDRSQATPGALWTSASGSNIYHPAHWNYDSLGLVFGIAIGGDQNIYVTSTTVYGCEQSNFHPFGPAGASGIYKVNPVDESIEHFVITDIDNIFSPGSSEIPNSGAGLGNICYDPVHDQFFVTNLSDGMIYRISSNGIVIDRYDPFSTTNNPSTDNPDFIELGERPWGIGYNHIDNKIYFSNWRQDRSRRNPNIYNEIWSLPLDNLGAFTGSNSGSTFSGNDQKEFDLPNNIDYVDATIYTDYSNPVSDIAFSDKGLMLISERSMSSDCGSNRYLFISFYQHYAHNSRVLEYVYSPTSSNWQLSPGHSPQVNGQEFSNYSSDLKFLLGIENFTIGANSAGGIDYGYESFIELISDTVMCDNMIWSSADYMQNNCSGNEKYYGLQGINSYGGNQCDSYIIDYNGLAGSQDKNLQGDVEIFKCGNCPPNGCEITVGIEEIDCYEKIFFPQTASMDDNTDIYWTVDGVWQFSGGKNDPFTLSNLPNGTYTVCAFASDGTCETEFCIDVLFDDCPGGCCEDTEAFEDRFDDNFLVSTTDCQVVIDPLGLEDCDDIIIDWGDNSTDMSSGGQVITHSYSQSGDYNICVSVSMFDDNGIACITRDTCWDICVVCDSCENANFNKVWTQGFANFYPFGNEENKFGIATDNSNIYIAAAYSDVFDYNGSNLLPASGNISAFWGKLDMNGNPIWLLSAGSDSINIATSIKVDSNGDIYIGGWFTKSEITLTSIGGGNSETLTNVRPGKEDIFIAKYNNSGVLQWANRYGNTAHEKLYDLEFDSNGGVVIVGLYSWYGLNFSSTMSEILPDPELNGGYIAKFDMNGSYLWSMPIYSDVWGIRTYTTCLNIDANDNIYVGGTFLGNVDFNPLGSPNIKTACPSCANMFIARYSPNGILDWIGNVGNQGSDQTFVTPWGIDIFNDDLFITGQMSGFNIEFNPLNTSNSISLSSLSPNLNGFLGKYDANTGEADWAFALDLNGKSFDVVADANGNPAIAGFFNRNINTQLDVDPDPTENYNLISHGTDGFFAKYTNAGDFITAFNPYSTGGKDEFQTIEFANNGDLLVFGYHGSNKFDDDPALDNQTYLNAGTIPDLFLGRYNCNCVGQDTECCDDLEVFIEELESESDTCCYSMSISNNSDQSIPYIDLELISPDWVFSSGSLASGWQFDIVTNDFYRLKHISGLIPAGTSTDILSYCLSSTDNAAPPVQEVVVKWPGLDILNDQTNIICTDTLVTECPVNDNDCLDIIFDTPECIEGAYNEYTFNFQVVNNSNVSASVVVLSSLDPNFTLVECYLPSQFGYQNIIYSFTDILDPGETSENICVKVISNNPLIVPTQFCFTATLEGAGAQSCCTEAEEFCFELNPCCDPCSSTEVISEVLIDTSGCCYELDIINECLPNFFTKVELEINSSTAQFGHIANNRPDQFTFQVSDDQSIIWDPVLDYIPVDTLEDAISFCIQDSLFDNSSYEILVHWYTDAADSLDEFIVCTDTLILECNAPDSLECLTVELEEIKCIDDNLFELIINVTNSSNPSFDASQININSTQGLTVINGAIGLIPPLTSGQSAQYSVWVTDDQLILQGPMIFELSIKDLFGESCCQEFATLIVDIPFDLPCVVSTTAQRGKSIDIKVFPNPSSDNFNVLFDQPLQETMRMNVFDMHGRVVYSKQLEVGMQLEDVDLSSFSSGVYFLEIRNDAGLSETIKLVKIGF